VEGICSDYAVNFGSGTSNAEGNNGAVYWNLNTAAGVPDPGKGISIMQIEDGTSNTFLLGEKHVRPEDIGSPDPGMDGPIYVAGDGPHWPWTGRKAGTAFPLAISPSDPQLGQFGSWHAGVTQFAFCDGSVRSIQNSTAGSILRLLAARNDGQPIPSFD